MKLEADSLMESMEDVFSALSPEDVTAQSKEVVSKYLEGNTSGIGQIMWADLDLDGKFLRGGVSDTELMRSQIINDHRSDPVVAEIVRITGDGELRPGKLVHADRIAGHIWCVPYRVEQSTGNAQNCIRAIHLTESLFYQVLELFNSDVGLTRSEKRIIYQLVIGLNPSRAAQSDGVSVETKRSQLKTAAGKLQCHSQSEMVRYLVSQLIHLLYLCEAETSNIGLTERFGSEFFDTRARLLVQRMQSGRLVRYWEFGPDDGRPVLVMHGYLFPSLVLKAETELEKHRLRLIMPLRGGFLDGLPASGMLEIQQLADDNLEDLTEFAESVCKEPTTLLGHNMGGAYAMLLAKRRADLFSHVIVASINLMGSKEGSETFASKFVSGLRNLANETGIYEIAARQFRKTALQNETITRLVLRRLFKDSPDDLDFIEGRAGSPPAYAWFRQITLHSVLGLTSDVNLLSGPIEDYVKGIEAPVTFIHGNADPYTGVDELTDYAALNKKSKLRILTVGGHYVSASHPSEFWAAVNDGIAGG